MMKIHTTQNLNTLGNQTSTNSVLSKEFRLSQKLSQLRSLPDSYASEVSFGSRKKPSSKDTKKIVNSVKKKVGEMKDKAAPDPQKWDKFLNSRAFEKMLKLAENEPVVQAAISALICILLRPITIMALPSKKGKQDNMYASAHSISSGIMGLVSALVIAQPFKNGASYVMKNMYKDLNESTLKRLNPHLDITSIKNADGSRKEINEWLDKQGNKFSKDFKNVDKIAKFKHFNKISKETFKYFGADVDWEKFKGKSFNDVITKDGKSLYDALDKNILGIIVKQEGKDAAPVLLRDLNKNFLKEIINDAEKTSEWSKLDINSVYSDAEKNIVKDFREWKDIDGKQWKLDLDSAYISSPYDTADYIPRISGETRIDKNGNEKYITYLKNGKDGALGTKITQDLVDTAARNEVHDKILTWFPDIITRPFVAAGTIALIPLALKEVFHIEKSKKPAEEKCQSDKINSNDLKEEKNISFKGSSDNSAIKTPQISFKAKQTPGKSAWDRFMENVIAKPLAKIYGKPLYESKRTSNVAEKLTKLPGKMTEHMATLGSLLTSSVYVQQTLNKKDLDPERKRTLAINQIFCFVIPTICAYTVNNLIGNWVKKKEYRYAGLQENKMLNAERQGNKELAAKIQSSLGKNLKGVRIIASLATFSLIYRYLTPVAITPLATYIGNKLNESKNKC